MWKYLPRSVFSPAWEPSILPSDSPASNPEPSATSSGTSTVSPSLRPGCVTVSSQTPPSGTMSESSTVHPGAAAWISSLPVRPANLIVKPENSAETGTIETSSPIRSESLARYSPEESIWRTCQVCLFDQRMDGQPMGEPWSESWPRSGMTVDGTLYQRKTLAHRISENGGGSWPTPAAQEPGWKHIEVVDAHGCSPPCHPNQRFYDKNTGRLVQKGLTQIAQWPTPRSADTGGMTLEQADERMANRKAEGKTTGGFNDLKKAVGMWPTPVADGDRTTNFKQGGTSLGHAARSLMLPTPQAMDSVTRSKESFHRIMDRPRQGAMLPKLADIIHVAPMLPTPSATKNTPNTVDVADLVDSDGNPWPVSYTHLTLPTIYSV